MYDTIDKSIEFLAKQAGKDMQTPDAVLKITQAALNLAHVKATLDMLKKP